MPTSPTELGPAESELVSAALSALWGAVEGAMRGVDTSRMGVPAFDLLRPGQQLTLLAEVGRALLVVAAPARRRSACAEAALEALYRIVHDEIAMELTTMPADAATGMVRPSTFWRGRARRAYLEAFEPWRADGLGEDDHVPSDDGCTCGMGDVPDEDRGDVDPRDDAQSEDHEAWWDLVERLAARVLPEDRCHRRIEEFLDADPRTSRAFREAWGLPEDYFISAPTEPAGPELASARSILAGLCGEPGRGDLAMAAGLHDLHHDLLVGPCNADVIARETASCWLVVRADVPGGDSEFQCSYEEWTERFLGEVLRAAGESNPLPPGPAQVLSPDQLAEAARAEQAGTPLDLGGGLSAVPENGSWIVVGGDGECLADPLSWSWASDRYDEHLRPRRFPTAAEAFAALVWGRALDDSRRSRNGSCFGG